MLAFPHLLPTLLRSPLCSDAHRCGRRRRVQSKETDTSYEYQVQVPGVAPDGVKLAVRDDSTLKLSAVDPSGRSVIDQTFALEEDADPTTVQAWCADGLLTVRMAKLAPPEALHIIVTDTNFDPATTSKDDATGAEELKLKFPLPGIAAADCTVTIQDQVLHIEAGGKGRQQHRFGMALPEDVEVSRASANLRHGLLRLRLPRRAPPEPHTIPVVAGAAAIEGARELAVVNVPGYGADHLALTIADPAAGDGQCELTLRGDANGAARERVLRFTVRDMPRVSDAAGLRAEVRDGALRLSVAREACGDGATEVQVVASRPPTPAAAATEAPAGSDEPMEAQ